MRWGTASTGGADKARDAAGGRSDEEPEDPKGKMEEECRPQCAKFVLKYDECAKRVEQDSSGEAHCTGQFFDLQRCIDQCVRPTVLCSFAGPAPSESTGALFPSAGCPEAVQARQVTFTPSFAVLPLFMSDL